MTSQHTTRCFFGCNAGSGFHTFFNFLPRLEGSRIIIVKGGPGTGKSTFISAIGETFAQRVMIWSISIAPCTLSRMTPLSFRH